MKHTEEEFLARIRQQPGNDDIRLIFADWLEELGDDRAEFIRVQCECARWESNPEQSDVPRLKEHEAKLAKLWRDACLQELSPLGVRDVRFSRGFVERAHLEGTAFLSRTKRIAEWAPALEGVLWQNIPRQSAKPIERFLDSPVFQGLASLNLMRNNLASAGLKALASSAGLAGVRSLSLRENFVGGQGMQELMRSPYLSHLTRWDLTDTQLSLVDARTLARAASLHQLEELILNLNQIGDAGLRAIANAARFATLRKLSVAGNQIAQEGIRALADSAYLTDLQVLDLSGNEIGDAGLSLMAMASNYARLSELNLASCGIRETGLTALSESTYFARLTTLDLSHNSIGKSLTSLLQSRLMEPLRTLRLRHCDLDSQSVRVLISGDDSLELLDLRDNPMINSYSRENLLEKFGPKLLLDD